MAGKGKACPPGQEKGKMPMEKGEMPAFMQKGKTSSKKKGK